MEPITRVEQFLAKAAGITSDCPEPITRVEKFLQKIAENGGSGINVTAAVGQTIRVKAVDENGKPTEWEAANYQPRTHYIDEGVLYEGTHEVNANGEFVLHRPPDLTVGKTYKIVWNGVEYSCVAVDTTDTLGGVALGNVDAMLGSGDTGEPFLLVVVEGIGVGFPVDGSTSVTLSIVGEMAIPIPAEYLSNAYPYYIEITGSGKTDDPYVCYDTVANVTEIYNSGRQLGIRIHKDAGTLLFPINQTGNLDYGMSYAACLPYTMRLILGHDFITLTAQEDGTFAVKTQTVSLD